MKQRVLVAGSIVVGLALSLSLGFWESSRSKTQPAPEGSSSKSQPAPERSRPIVAGPQPDRDVGPFLLGQKLATIAEAEEAAGYHFVRPDDALANDALVMAAFVEEVPGDKNAETDCLRSDVRQGAVDYTSGILVMVELVSGTGCPFDLDPEGSYETMAATSGGLWQTTTVDSVTALVSPGYEKNSSPAFVDLTIQGIRVRIFAMYAPIDLATLTAVAETLK